MVLVPAPIPSYAYSESIQRQTERDGLEGDSNCFCSIFLRLPRLLEQRYTL